MMSAEGEFGTRVGHIQYFRDCPASFGTVGNYEIVAYYDEMETANALGPKASKNKLGALIIV